MSRRNGATHRYQLTGLLICGNCGRRLESHWIHGHAGYRCRHGHTSTRPRGERLQSLYWAERRILDELLYAPSYHGGGLPLLAGTDDLLSYLHGRDLVIVCGPSELRLEANKPNQQITPTATIPRWDDFGGG